MANAAAAAVLYRIYELPWSTGRPAGHEVSQDRRELALARDDRARARHRGAPCTRPAIRPGARGPEAPREARARSPQASAASAGRREGARAEAEPVEQKQVKEEPPKPKPKPEPQPEKQVDKTEQARERAKVAGLLPFAQQLAALRDDKTIERLDKTQLAGKVEGTAPLAERSLITSRVGTSSGGINTAALSRNTGGGGIGDRATTKVESPVEGLAVAGGAAQRTGESNKAARSREEIERVFDVNKGSIYALYNRALRQNPRCKASSC